MPAACARSPTTASSEVLPIPASPSTSTSPPPSPAATRSTAEASAARSASRSSNSPDITRKAYGAGTSRYGAQAARGAGSVLMEPDADNRAPPHPVILISPLRTLTLRPAIPPPTASPPSRASSIAIGPSRRAAPAVQERFASRSFITMTPRPVGRQDDGGGSQNDVLGAARTGRYPQHIKELASGEEPGAMITPAERASPCEQPGAPPSRRLVGTPDSTRSARGRRWTVKTGRPPR